MSIAPYIKEIGRGKDGARPLNAEQAEDLLSQVLDGQVTDLEIGAFCLAMRIKGEAVPELDGFVRATLARSLPVHEAAEALAANASARPIKGMVVLPSYNGARKLPNLTALLAALLAREGVAVLVHGPERDPTRVTTAQVFDALGWPAARTVADLTGQWLAGQPAFMPIASLCPGLARLLDVRWTVGLRNPAHTVAKLLDPFAGAGCGAPRPTALPSLRVVNHTHPEYAHSLTAYLQHAAADALLMRGTEGEPVADARRQPRFDAFVQGIKHAALSRAQVDGVLTALPALPEDARADTTAAWIHRVLAGDVPTPDAILGQRDCLLAMLALLAERTPT